MVPTELLAEIVTFLTWDIEVSATSGGTVYRRVNYLR
jgi:hypothetical protein